MLTDLIDPSILLEIDTYWAGTAGQDVPALLGRLGDRVIALHLKDGPLNGNVSEQLPLGQGELPAVEIIAAAKALEFPVLEFDAYAGDIFDGIAASYAYRHRHSRSPEMSDTGTVRRVGAGKISEQYLANMTSSSSTMRPTLAAPDPHFFTRRHQSDPQRQRRKGDHRGGRARRTRHRRSGHGPRGRCGHTVITDCDRPAAACTFWTRCWPPPIDRPAGIRRRRLTSRPRPPLPPGGTPPYERCETGSRAAIGPLDEPLPALNNLRSDRPAT